MTNLKEFSRYDLLLSQFQEDGLGLKAQQSLDRIFSFVYEYTDIHYLVFLRQETLTDYLKFHCSRNFEVISFMQAVEDIKTLQAFMEKKKEIKSVPKIDLSLQNLNLWMLLDTPTTFRTEQIV